MTLQAICDANKKFIDVCTGTPRRMHDVRVYAYSKISKNLQQIYEGKYHILGDGAYEIREWLLTPFRNYENLPNQRKKYNDKFCATRVVIENAFGILKQRFLQLLRVELADVDRITKFVISCCVLHNICLDGDDDVPEIAGEIITDETIGRVHRSICNGCGVGSRGVSWLCVSGCCCRVFAFPPYVTNSTDDFWLN